MDRYGRWIGAPEVRPRRLVPEREAIDLALKDGDWLGLAVFVYASGEWTVIEELSGGLALRSAESWLELAQGGELVYAGYNDTVPYAQIVMVERGHLVRQYLQDAGLECRRGYRSAIGGSEAAVSGLDRRNGVGGG